MIELRVVTTGGKYWYLNNQLHRANGPAIVWDNLVIARYWHGKRVTEYEHMMLVGQERTNG